MHSETNLIISKKFLSIFCSRKENPIFFSYVPSMLMAAELSGYIALRGTVLVALSSRLSVVQRVVCLYEITYCIHKQENTRVACNLTVKPPAFIQQNQRNENCILLNPRG